MWEDKMKIDIVNITRKENENYQVTAKIFNDIFSAEWHSGEPFKKSYEVEMELDEELIWNENIRASDKGVDSIIQDGECIKIFARLDYNHEDDLAALYIYNSIILIDLLGANQDLSAIRIEALCESIKLYDVNL